VPADFAGSEWRDSRGCRFVRATVAGAVTWLPLLDAERRPLCDAPALAEVPDAAVEADLAQAPPTEDSPAEAAPDVDPQIAEAAEVLARVARIATGQGRAAPPAEAPPPAAPPAIAAAPQPDPFAALGRMAEETAGPTGRLIFVPPDDRVRIVQVDMPSVLRGGDPFGVNEPIVGPAHAAPRAATRVGYHPAPIRLAQAPPIPGFGPDPAPAVRIRRAALAEGADGSNLER
jgi:hypothetical protein